MFRELGVLVGVIMIVIMMVIPVPPFLLDFFILLNISLSLTILLVSMNTKESLQFSIFPSLLLLTTLFRLSLNVSTTRSILTTMNGGEVIKAFGNFVVGGQPIIGLIVFLILVIIQFIVITKGSERVAEVAARFTLDAMPGKQMSIDADLNAGLIHEEEARNRRRRIEREADFYGAMDGASKFVKGDAIASIIILAVNVLGGLIIGTLIHGKSLQEAASVYTLLSVGDGLVSQIPALLISTATGIIVTRAASEGNLGEDLLQQLLSYPKLLYVVAGVLFILGLLTPIPDLITIPLSAVVFYGGYTMERARKKKEEKAFIEERMERDAELAKGPESVLNLLDMDPVEFEFGYALIPLADPNQGGDLMDRVLMIRRQLALELGFIVPTVRFRDNIQLKPNQYTIKIKGSRVAQGEIFLDRYLAMSPGIDDDSITGIPTTEPAFGLEALWIDETMKEKAELSGYTVVDPPSVVATHLTEILKRHAHELLGREETKALIEHLKTTHPALVEELVPSLLSVGEIQKVLAKLLKERVSIRNLVVIFEALANHAAYTKNPDILTEYVRQALSRQITSTYVKEGSVLKVIHVSPALEKVIADSVQHTEQGSYLALSPEKSQEIYDHLSKQVKKAQEMGISPLLLASPATRMYLRQLLDRILPDLPVLSYNELEPDVEIQSVGMVS
ncbi:flagellar biosynthesis protein FlhA [Thermicanus aegyptius]|uniref:flagellar biosynthesis protein FlhA n=1 Tax=Thermicanus aegyptius TaxID=94009 RepID=UPI0003F8D69A|nr:flagellar biosynthesis protein FlhA [Thermicanus aegyptius]